jgi:hypothetical protein
VQARLLFTGVRGIGILRTSPFGHSRKFALRSSHLAYDLACLGTYDLACLGIEKNGHVAYSADAPKLVRLFTSAGAAASR